MVKLNDFDFSLPETSIAQKPLEQRDASKLLILRGNIIEHKKFIEIIHELEKDDVLVLNDSKVIASRFNGIKKTGGNVSLLFIREIEPSRWQCMIRGKKVRPKSKISIENGLFEIEVIKRIREGIFLTQVFSEEPMEKLFKKHGMLPIPNYIKNFDHNSDSGKYQTVFAKHLGSIAAPTAGFHFTDDLLFKIEKKGIKIGKITLHVGAGLIFKIHVNDPKDYQMEPEYFEIREDVAEIINDARSKGNKVVAVGTTSLKTLQCGSSNKGKIQAIRGYSDHFIYPGYEFKFKPDSLISNFHLPKSPPLLMVAAFAGTKRLLNAYQVAIKNHYRFYSFGDAMFIIS